MLRDSSMAASQAVFAAFAVHISFTPRRPRLQVLYRPLSQVPRLSASRVFPRTWWYFANSLAREFGENMA